MPMPRSTKRQRSNRSTYFLGRSAATWQTALATRPETPRRSTPLNDVSI